MDISANCKCKYKAYVLVCCRCGKSATLCESDTKENKLNEMKKRLQKLITEKTILRMEIQELEDEILDEKIISQD